jgi:hypothetical protein
MDMVEEEISVKQYRHQLVQQLPDDGKMNQKVFCGDMIERFEATSFSVMKPSFIFMEM